MHGGIHLPQARHLEDENRIGVVVSVGPGRFCERLYAGLIEELIANRAEVGEGGERLPFRYPGDFPARAAACAPIDVQVGDTIVYSQAMAIYPGGPAGPVFYAVPGAAITSKISGWEILEVTGTPQTEGAEEEEEPTAVEPGQEFNPQVGDLVEATIGAVAGKVGRVLERHPATCLVQFSTEMILRYHLKHLVKPSEAKAGEAALRFPSSTHPGTTPNGGPVAGEAEAGKP